jgi:hypothetical protein
MTFYDFDEEVIFSHFFSRNTRIVVFRCRLVGLAIISTHEAHSSMNEKSCRLNCLDFYLTSVRVGLNYDPRPKELQYRAILLVVIKTLDPRSLHYTPGPRYEKNEVALTWHLFPLPSLVGVE